MTIIAPPSSTEKHLLVSQLFLQFNVHRCHLKISLKCRFWTCRSRLGPEVLHCSQAPRGNWCCWSLDKALTNSMSSLHTASNERRAQGIASQSVWQETEGGKDWLGSDLKEPWAPGEEFKWYYVLRNHCRFLYRFYSDMIGPVLKGDLSVIMYSTGGVEVSY